MLKKATRMFVFAVITLAVATIAIVLAGKFLHPPIEYLFGGLEVLLLFSTIVVVMLDETLLSIIYPATVSLILVGFGYTVQVLDPSFGTDAKWPPPITAAFVVTISILIVGFATLWVCNHRRSEKSRKQVGRVLHFQRHFTFPD